MSYKMHILVCGGTGCRASASKNIICRLEDCLKERALEDEYRSSLPAVSVSVRKVLLSRSCLTIPFMYR